MTRIFLALADIKEDKKVTAIRTSVILPTFNRLDALRACVRALHKQTCSFDDFEVIVVDDGSARPIEVSELVDQSHRSPSNLQLRVIRQVNSGPAAARNFGAQNAKGELLAFIDDDCLAHDNWLEKLLDMHQQYPQALIGGLSANALHENIFSVASQLILDIVYEYYNGDPCDAVFLASNNWLCRRELFLSVGGFDESFRQAGGEDRDFCARWRGAGYSIAWQKEAVADHRHFQSLSKFVNMHFRYGQGAFGFHASKVQSDPRNGNSTIGFYLQLFPAAIRHVRCVPSWWKRVQVVGLLVIWQFFNALGFVQQALKSSLGKRRNSKKQYQVEYVASREIESVDNGSKSCCRSSVRAEEIIR